MRNDIYEMKRTRQQGRGRQAARPAERDLPREAGAGKWYTYTVETVGDEMRASIDGVAVGLT